MMNIGQRIREVREDLGMSASVLARRVDVAPNTIWRIEHGERTPSMGLLARIARELRTEPAELLREPEREPELALPKGEAPGTGQRLSAEEMIEVLNLLAEGLRASGVEADVVNRLANRMFEDMIDALRKTPTPEADHLADLLLGEGQATSQ